MKGLLDKRNYLLTSQNFMVSFDDTVIVGFSKVSNIEAGMEYETVTEGGNNDFPYVLQKPKGQADKLLMEKGVYAGVGESMLDFLDIGCRLKNIVIWTDGRVFAVDNGTIVSRKFSDLNAMGNDIMIETLEILHDGLWHL